MPPSTDGMEAVHLTIELLQRIPKQRKITANGLQSQLAGAGYARNLPSIQPQLKHITDHLYRDCRFEGFDNERTGIVSAPFGGSVHYGISGAQEVSRREKKVVSRAQ